LPKIGGPGPRAPSPLDPLLDHMARRIPLHPLYGFAAASGIKQLIATRHGRQFSLARLLNRVGRATRLGSNSISTGVLVCTRPTRYLAVPFRLCPFLSWSRRRRGPIDTVTARRVFGGVPREVKFVCTGVKTQQSWTARAFCRRLCSWSLLRQVCVPVTNEICKHCLVINATTHTTHPWWVVCNHHTFVELSLCNNLLQC